MNRRDFLKTTSATLAAAGLMPTLLIEYDPHPPLDSGSTAKASAVTIDRARQMLRDVYAQPRETAVR